MLDLLFALSVFTAILFFGALISFGNERQRRAIDNLHLQVARWAEADLRLKRSQAARQVRVEDPAVWLHTVAVKVIGALPRVLSLTPWKADGEIQAVVGLCADGRRLVVTPLLPSRFKKLALANSQSRAARAEVSLLGDNPRQVAVHELSLVTAGAFFDIEAAQAWSLVTGQALGAERLYLFEVPAANPHR